MRIVSRSKHSLTSQHMGAVCSFGDVQDNGTAFREEEVSAAQVLRPHRDSVDTELRDSFTHSGHNSETATSRGESHDEGQDEASLSDANGFGRVSSLDVTHRSIGGNRHRCGTAAGSSAAANHALDVTNPFLVSPFRQLQQADPKSFALQVQQQPSPSCDPAASVEEDLSPQHSTVSPKGVSSTSIASKQRRPRGHTRETSNDGMLGSIRDAAASTASAVSVDLLFNTTMNSTSMADSTGSPRLSASRHTGRKATAPSSSFRSVLPSEAPLANLVKPPGGTGTTHTLTVNDLDSAASREDARKALFHAVESRTAEAAELLVQQCARIRQGGETSWERMPEYHHAAGGTPPLSIKDSADFGDVVTEEDVKSASSAPLS